MKKTHAIKLTAEEYRETVEQLIGGVQMEESIRRLYETGETFPPDLRKKLSAFYEVNVQDIFTDSIGNIWVEYEDTNELFFEEKVISEDDIPEVAGQIIDIFEDYLTEKKFVSEDGVAIEGKTYDSIADEIIVPLKGLLESGKSKFDDTDAQQVVANVYNEFVSQFPSIDLSSQEDAWLINGIKQVLISNGVAGESYWMTFSVNGSYSCEVRSIGLDDAKQEALCRFYDADFGELSDVDGDITSAESNGEDIYFD